MVTACKRLRLLAIKKEERFSVQMGEPRLVHAVVCRCMCWQAWCVGFVFCLCDDHGALVCASQLHLSFSSSRSLPSLPLSPS